MKVKRNGATYPGASTDGKHFKFEVSDIKRSGKYEFDLLDGSNLITKITINAKGAVGSANSGFDDLF